MKVLVLFKTHRRSLIVKSSCDQQHVPRRELWQASRKKAITTYSHATSTLACSVLPPSLFLFLQLSRSSTSDQHSPSSLTRITSRSSCYITSHSSCPWTTFPCDTLCTAHVNTRSNKLKMASKTALSPTPEPVSVQDDSQSFRFLDLPLEVRLMVYTIIATRPENHYRPERIHGHRVLPSVFHAHPQITREIYQFCTITADFKHHEQGFPNDVFSFLSIRYLKDAAKRLITFNAQKNHKGAVLEIRLRCSDRDCSKKCCESCRKCAESRYILPIEAMGFERRFITLV